LGGWGGEAEGNKRRGGGWTEGVAGREEGPWRGVGRRRRVGVLGLGQFPVPKSSRVDGGARRQGAKGRGRRVAGRSRGGRGRVVGGVDERVDLHVPKGQKRAAADACLVRGGKMSKGGARIWPVVARRQRRLRAQGRGALPQVAWGALGQRHGGGGGWNCARISRGGPTSVGGGARRAEGGGARRAAVAGHGLSSRA
jgi:hypothetical protein